MTHAKLCIYMLLLLLPLWTGIAADLKSNHAAIIKDIKLKNNRHIFVLDFVTIRDCKCETGIEIVNQNKKHRELVLDPRGKIWLLKNAGEYRQVSLQDLLDARAGKDFGWAFDTNTPFRFRFDAKKTQIVEMWQVYLP